jgi:polyisoprenoid-binding protein YceI
MNKYFLLAGLFFSINTLQAQQLSADHGEIEFYTETVLSDIEAFSEKFDAVLDIQTGIFEVKVSIQSFDFEYELMQEHFNEKYMESDKFPIATFKGKISQDISNITEEIDVDISGEMNIHGITKEIQAKANISKLDSLTVVKCKIPIVFKDFNVDEPAILKKSVAKDVMVKSVLYFK